ncbi:anoctamin-4-like isoform X2 [Amblyomma americanum]
MVPWACIGPRELLLSSRSLTNTFVAVRCIVNRDLRTARVQPRFAAVSSKILREKPAKDVNTDLGDDPAQPNEPDAELDKGPPSVHKKTSKKKPSEKATNKSQDKPVKKNADKGKSDPPKSSKDKVDGSTLKKGKKAQGSKDKQGKEKVVHDEQDQNEPQPDEPEVAADENDQDHLLPTEDKPEGYHETRSEKAKAKGKSKAKQGTAGSAKKGQKGVKSGIKHPSKTAVLEDEEHEEDTQRKKPAQKHLSQTKKSEGKKARGKASNAASSKETLKKAPAKKPPAKPPKKADKLLRRPSTRFAEEASVKEMSIISGGDTGQPVVEGQPEDVPLLPDDQRTLFFEDGLRRIDIVLAYEDHGNPTHERYRRIFQENLEEEGLDIEIVNGEDSWDGYTYFVKVHAPWPVLSKYAEQLHMRMPVKKKGPAMAFPKIKIKPGEKPIFPDMRVFESDSVEIEVVGKAPSKKKLSRLKSPFPYDKKLIPDENEFYNAEFVRQREAMYLIGNKDTFFSQAARSRMTWEVLTRAKYDEAEHQRGVHNLLSLGVYSAAYPLHDGPFGKGRFNKATETYAERRVLYAEWGRVRCWYKEQPLVLIRRYFGEKVGLYFAWIGFYTTMLILPAFVGIFTSLYGLAYMLTNKPTEEACDPNTFGNFTLCPSCMKLCPYDRLGNKCTITKIVSIFDNSGTVGFSVFMSLWATIFIEFWKRQQVVLAWEWNLSNVDTLTRYEPHVPFWERIGRVAAANVILLLMLCVVICTVMGMIGYRIVMVTFLSSKFSRPVAHIGTSASASMFNLAIILGMNKVYGWVAARLTDLERPRTQRDYEYSFAFKMFLFTFLNNYSTLIYIAFFKGRFSGDPGRETHWRGYTLDKCEGGCLYEVFVQLATVMVGQQLIKTGNKVVIPIFQAWWRQRRRRQGKELLPEQRAALARWEEDYLLEECPKLAPFDEYLEMTIQFGFVTLFVAAFPLAPLFALINNISQIRLDAYRYSKRLRRPVAERAPNIGAWQAILRILARCAVICNAFLIAFTSEFIPRLVYQVRHSKGLSLSGYVNFTMALFDTSDYDDVHRPNNGTLDGSIVRECRYVGFREPPGTENEYQLSGTFWVITTAQLCFVVIFEHVVFFITGVVAGMIPAMPKSVAQRMKREQIVVQNLIAKF